MPFDRGEVKSQARNTLCPHYSACLSSALNHNSTGFSCADCAKRSEYEPILHEEVLRAGRLLGEIFFRSERETLVTATCPRCGKVHRCISCPGGSPRRFCQHCITVDGSSNASASGVEHSVELRSAPRVPVVPLEDEPGVDGDE